VFPYVEPVTVGRYDGAFGLLLGLEDPGGFGEELAAAFGGGYGGDPTVEES
jgi:hypothetical protein